MGERTFLIVNLGKKMRGGVKIIPAQIYAGVDILHDSLSSRVRAGAASGVGALSSIAFVLFALIFGGVSQHVGIFHAGWLVVGVTLLVSALLVKVALGQDFQGQEASDEPSSSGAA